MSELTTLSKHQLQWNTYFSKTLLYVLKDIEARTIVCSIPQWYWSYDWNIDLLVSDFDSFGSLEAVEHILSWCEYLPRNEEEIPKKMAIHTIQRVITSIYQEECL